MRERVCVSAPLNKGIMSKRDIDEAKDLVNMLVLAEYALLNLLGYFFEVAGGVAEIFGIGVI